jgi:hypothetical protein
MHLLFHYQTPRIEALLSTIDFNLVYNYMHLMSQSIIELTNGAKRKLQAVVDS